MHTYSSQIAVKFHRLLWKFIRDPYIFTQDQKDVCFFAPHYFINTVITQNHAKEWSQMFIQNRE